MAGARRAASFGIGVLLAAATLATGMQPAAAKPWRFGILDAKSDAGFSFMIGKGFAEKQGIEIELLQFQTDVTGLQALLSGSVDSFEGSPGNAVVAAARGADVKFIGCTWPGLPHVLFVRDAIGSVADLKGKTIGSGPNGALPDLLTRLILDKYGVPADSVHFANLGNDVSRYKALVVGQVDAALVSGEFTPVSAQQRVKPLVEAETVVPEYPRLCIETTGKTLTERPDDAVHFAAAEMSALRFAVTHRDETLALTRKMTQDKDDDPRPGYIFDWAVKTHAVDPTIAVPEAKLAFVQEMAIKTGNLTAPGSIDKMVDSTIRTKALPLAGE